MTNNNQEWRCIKEDTLSHHEAQIQALNTKNNYKHEKIQEILTRQTRFEEKLDQILSELHQQKLDNAKDDSSIDHRLTAIETKQALQDKITEQNYNKTMIIISIVGLFLTGLTILLNYLHI